jgi:hypothetical protein
MRQSRRPNAGARRSHLAHRWRPWLRLESSTDGPDETLPPDVPGEALADQPSLWPEPEAQALGEMGTVERPE